MNYNKNNLNKTSSPKIWHSQEVLSNLIYGFNVTNVCSNHDHSTVSCYCHYYQNRKLLQMIVDGLSALQWLAVVYVSYARIIKAGSWIFLNRSAKV